MTQKASYNAASLSDGVSRGSIGRPSLAGLGSLHPALTHPLVEKVARHTKPVQLNGAAERVRLCRSWERSTLDREPHFMMTAAPCNVEERRRLKIILSGLGEKPVLKLMPDDDRRQLNKQVAAFQGDEVLTFDVDHEEPILERTR